MDAITVRSTSQHSALASDIELRVTTTTRLIFRPEIVDNPNNRSASVRGRFVFQRKKPSEPWEDVPSEKFSTLKSGEGYSLELASAELLTLCNELSGLYALHSKEGVPIGDNRYVRVPSFVEQIADITIEEMVSALVNHGEAGVDALVKLLSWAGRTTNLHQLVGRLRAVHPNVLQSLSASVKLAELCQLRDHWLQNQQNAKEEFWQQLLAEHSFLLEQCFAFPISVINGKAYAGGKNLLNKGAQLPDFIVKNSMTQNLGLVEIKTPVADVLGKPYRGGILPLGAEVNGAVAQVLTYRASLQQEVVQMSYNEAERREAWAPPAVVICGTAKHLKPNERRSFELLRRQYHDVEILCFDELYARLESLISLLEEAEQPDAEAPEEDSDDLGY